jgi:nicotinamide mononucleotide transporter
MRKLFGLWTFGESIFSLLLAIVLTIGCSIVAGDYSLGFSTLEFIGTVLNFACVYLAVRENAWSWIYGIAGCIILGLVFAFAGLTSSMILNLPLQFYGLHQWLYGGENKTELKIRSIKVWQMILFTVMGAAAWAVWVFVLKITTYSAFAVILIDAGILWVSVVAQWYLAKKYYQAWTLWLLVNVLSVFLYWYTGLKLVSLQYMVFFIHAGYGLYSWKKIYHNGYFDSKEIPVNAAPGHR